MSNLTQANRQWSSRPADERFVSLEALYEHVATRRQNSSELVVNTNAFKAVGRADGVALRSSVGEALLTNWSLGQVASLAHAPAGYLGSLSPELAAACLNEGLAGRGERVGLLLHKNGQVYADAVTGPRYGRVWNTSVVGALVREAPAAGFTVPGEFSKVVPVTKENTTLYAGDRDMWVFLANERNRIDVPGRRGGKDGSLARGFFVWNSEVGASTLGLGTFLFDYVCCNRIVWGARDFSEVRVRHTSGAPARWLREVLPQLRRFMESDTSRERAAVEAARAVKMNAELVSELLEKRFTRAFGAKVLAAAMAEEGRPIETLWDVVTAATAAARAIPHQDRRVEVERIAGLLLEEVLGAHVERRVN